MKTIEYRVRPVTRYIVTRYVAEYRVGLGGSVGSEMLGQFDSEAMADRAMEAFAWEEAFKGDPNNTRPAQPRTEDGKGIKFHVES